MQSSLNCVNGQPNPRPLQLNYGSYGTYEKIMNNDTTVRPNFDIPAEIGKAFLGELYHILGIDHIGPLRTHQEHMGFADGCEDTP